MMRNPRSMRQSQRGVAALLVTVLLCLAMLLGAAFASRNLAVEQRASANQYRSTQAFEVAEAGMEWALARLNDGAPIGADCLPSSDAAALSFRAGRLRTDAATHVIAPATWNDAGTATALRAACVRTASGWQCSCPANGVPSLPVNRDAETAPAFWIDLASGPRPSTVHATALGCTRADALCSTATDIGHEATARIEADFAYAPSLRALPAAALTARGDIAAGSAALGLHNTDAASGGIAAQSGGSIDASALRLSAPAGASLAGSLVSADSELAALDAERVFARTFGMSSALWIAQPGVAVLRCADDCTAPIAVAIARGATLIAIDGDARLAGPAGLGSSAVPIALVVRGRLQLRGDVAISGLVYAASLDWNHAAAPTAFVRGAVVLGGDYGGDAAADITHDASLLTRLQRSSGAFLRIAGSWKDF